MQTDVARAVIDVARIERTRRIANLEAEGEGASDQWLLIDEPFINELVLMALIALWHQMERHLIRLAASIPKDGDGILDNAAFLERVRHRKSQWHHERALLMEELGLQALPHWHSMQTLRHLANCYKHDPSMNPDKALLEHLGLPIVPEERYVVSYAALPESHLFREGFAESLGLDKRSDYCLIADELILRVERFLAAVRVSIPTWVQRTPVSLNEFEG